MNISWARQLKKKRSLQLRRKVEAVIPFSLVESSMAIQIVTKLSFVYGKKAQS